MMKIINKIYKNKKYIYFESSSETSMEMFDEIFVSIRSNCTKWIFLDNDAGTKLNATFMNEI